MLDFYRQIEVDDAYSIVFTVFEKHFALLRTKAEMLRAINAPGRIAFFADQAHVYQSIDFFTDLAHSPGFGHLARDKLSLCVPEDFASLDVFAGLIFALASDAEKQVVQRSGSAGVFAERHELWANDGDVFTDLAHTTATLSASAAMI